MGNLLWILIISIKKLNLGKIPSHCWHIENIDLGLIVALNMILVIARDADISKLITKKSSLEVI